MNNLASMIISFLAAIFLTLLPLPLDFVWYRPEFVAMWVLFWLIRSPQSFGLGTAWLVGLFLDALVGTTLAEHAMAMAIIAALTIRLQRQLHMITLWQQSLIIALFIFIYQSIIMLIQGMLGQANTLNWFWLSAMTSGLSWPLMTLFLSDKARPMPYQSYGNHRV